MLVEEDPYSYHSLQRRGCGHEVRGLCYKAMYETFFESPRGHSRSRRLAVCLLAYSIIDK